MTVHVDKNLDCEGHPGKGTIVINYNVKPNLFLLTII